MRNIQRLRSLLVWITLLTWVSHGYTVAQVLPSIGDTLYYFIDELPKHINASTVGTNVFWNFNSLKAPYIEYMTVEDPAERANQAFTGSAMVLVDQDGRESYLGKKASNLVHLGGSRFYLGTRAVFGDWRYSENTMDYIPRLSYGENRHDHGALSRFFSTEQLPTSVRDGLPLSIDSIRWDSEVLREYAADGKGKIQIPGGQYEVGRIKVVDQASHRIFVKRTGAAWEEASTEVQEMLVALYQPITFYFVSDDYSQPVAVVYADESEQPIFVQYMAEPYQAQYYTTSTAGQWLYAYPNPAFSTVRFKVFDIKPSRYEIHFYNILGKRLFKRTYDLAGTQTIELEIGQLEKGTYLYSLVDANGNKLITKRLIVLKP